MSVYKIIYLVAFLMTAIFSPPAPAGDGFDAIKAKVDEHAKKAFGQRGQVGVVVGVVKENEIRIWSYGQRVLGLHESPAADTYFEIGSLTKTFTSTLLALEVTRGRVRLSDQVKQFMHELEGMDGGEITLEELGTHTSGLPRLPDNLNVKDPLNPYRDYRDIELLQYLKSFKRRGAGSNPYLYSNLGLGLLGYILSERLNGVPYDIYLRSNLLDPLNLNDTKMHFLSSDIARAAVGHGSFLEQKPFWDFKILAGAGALKSTVADLLNYIKFNINPPSGVLEKAISLAQTPRKPSAQPAVNIALGWHTIQKATSHLITHSGGTGGFRSNLIFDKQKKIGAVVLSNTEITPECILAPVFELECSVPDFVVVSPSVQIKMLGNYRNQEIKMDIEVFQENGIFGVQPSGQPRARLWPKSETEFVIAEVNASLVFKRDSDGGFSGFELRQNGQTFSFEKTPQMMLIHNNQSDIFNYLRSR
jgi:CubicO group peptidase (beta-lactamase class C family)